MSTMREAFVLPVLFLTVGLLGGLRIAEVVRLVPPPLIALVLAMLLLGILVRSGALAPEGLMSAARSPLENLSGAMVLATLFGASAQMFNLLTPEYGLLHVAFSVCFFVQLATTLAGVSGGQNLLRSLVVLFGSAFVLRFIVLEALYAPDSGVVKRVLTAVIQGASLGTIGYQPNAAATGYVAFLTLAMFMTGLALLPTSPAQRPHVEALQPSGRPRGELLLLLVAAVLTGSAFNSPGQQDAVSGGATLPPAADSAARGLHREAALRAARVWQPPSVPIPQVDFSANPRTPDGFQASEEVSCRFVIQKLSGTTPKFRCALPDGRVLKVKYGARNPELAAEVAASRLLSALGFGADDMFVVRRVRCAGCPPFPFQALRCDEIIGIRPICFAGGLDYSRVRTFDTAVIEHRVEGDVIEAATDQGWAWYELDKIDEASGGSPRAEVDALRLLAVLLAHWDNKGPNQRLICRPGHTLHDGRCGAVIAMVQDLGATFGPLKLDLHNWRETPVWVDRATCTVSMKTLPFQGATFADHRIGEEGRQMLARLLGQLSDAQLADLFTTSRIVEHDQVLAEARDAASWVAVFRDKIRQVAEGERCPG
jgi:hypothetical protein